MITALTALGWLAAIALLFATVSSVIRAVHDKGGGQWTAASVFACLAVIVLAILGVLSPLWAAVLAAVPAIGVAGSFLFDKETTGGVIGHVAEGLGLSGGHLRGLWRLLLARLRGGAPEVEASSPEAAVAEAVATRGIPSVMEDPALGMAPEPAELVTSAVPAAAPYAALAQYIAGFEPEDDMSLRMFMEGNAAGSVMVADAWHHLGDTLLNTVGLDPAYVAGILEAGDSAGGHGSLLAQIHKRFGVIYAAVKEWISGHGPLPHKARDFLTGE